MPPQVAADEPRSKSPALQPVTPTAEKEAEEEDERERVLPNSAVTVALGHLMMASDIEYLSEILEGFGRASVWPAAPTTSKCVEAMEHVAPGERSGWSFGRSDEELRPTFELVRPGKMPEVETMLGKLLNNMLTTEVEREEGQVRKQRIDGSSLPSFEAVRRYLGPAGRVLRSEKTAGSSPGRC